MNRIGLFRSLFIISFISIMCISCNKDEPEIDESREPNPIEKPEDKIEYYVKYESSVYIPNSYPPTIDLVVVTENGTKSMKVPRTWEGTFGPFNELTTLYISSKTTGYNTNMTRCSGRISICRGNQPFILKAEVSSGGTSYSVSYDVKKSDLK